jgi:glycosyltransferase involved in cell wall biosynthesis
MATVSILIPAYKPEFLAKALSSARSQTYTDIEILVGDDNPDGRLRAIVESFDDPRIEYIHHGFRDGILNSRRLWERATGKYVKWLYDDDMLMPGSVEALVKALEMHPEAPMAFHERVLINEIDNVVHVPAPLIAAGQVACIDRRFLVNNMVVKGNNFIGEPTNTLIVREAVDPSIMMGYQSWGSFSFLTDVAMYLNFAERGPIALVGGYLSCFRRHGTQNSNPANPYFASCFFEWEIFVRGEGAAGQISAEGLVTAREYLRQMYTNGIEKLNFSELEPMRQNLDELTTRAPVDLVTPRFRADVANLRQIMEAKAARVASA